MLYVSSSGQLSSKAGTISCYLLSLIPEVAKSKIAGLEYRGGRLCRDTMTGAICVYITLERQEIND
jgi:hypothetical protein